MGAVFEKLVDRQRYGCSPERHLPAPRRGLAESLSSILPPPNTIHFGVTGSTAVGPHSVPPFFISLLVFWRACCSTVAVSLVAARSRAA